MVEYIDVDGGRIAYGVAGDGPLVVAAPGMGEIRQTYRFLVPILVDAGLRVATMDIRGHGDTSRNGWGSYGQTAIGADLVALIDHLGGPAIVVGQSFTPDSALFAATERPDAVTATVLIAPWARSPSLNPLLRIAQGAVVRVPALWAMFYRSLYPGARPADFDGYVSVLRTSLTGKRGMAALAAMADPVSRDAARYRARATQPALIVMGAKDPDFGDPRAEAEAMAADLAGPVEIVMIDGAGHYPHAQAPAKTGAAILDFLQRIGLQQAHDA